MTVTYFSGLVLLCSLEVHEVGVAAAARSSSAWMSDYSQARRLAQRTGRPIFLVFR